MKRLLVFVTHSILVIGCLFANSCTKDLSFSGGTLVQVFGPEKVDSYYGYDANGKKVGGGTFVNDVVYLNSAMSDGISYASKAYEYQGLVGGKGCYLYYNYAVDYSKTTTIKFTFQGDNLCVFTEEHAVKDARWRWMCTFCSHQNSSYAKNVGNGDTVKLGNQSSIVSSKTYSVISDPSAGSGEPRYVLYEGETYIEVYINGNEAHIIRRIPSLYDYGTFKISH